MEVYIRDHEGRIINGSNVALYYVKETSLLAHLVSGKVITLGVYSTPHEAKVALKSLSDKLDYTGCFYNIRKDEDII